MKQLFILIFVFLLLGCQSQKPVFDNNTYEVKLQVINDDDIIKLSDNDIQDMCLLNKFDNILYNNKNSIVFDLGVIPFTFSTMDDGLKYKNFKIEDVYINSYSFGEQNIKSYITDISIMENKSIDLMNVKLSFINIYLDKSTLTPSVNIQMTVPIINKVEYSFLVKNEYPVVSCKKLYDTIIIFKLLKNSVY